MKSSTRREGVCIRLGWEQPNISNAVCRHPNKIELEELLR